MGCKHRRNAARERRRNRAVRFVDSAYVGAHTIRVEGGTAYVPERSGLGVDVDEEKVARLRRRMEDD